ncbi:MAG: ComEC/Rec2 family competence protein [Patescibacteria group bacterium]
MLFSCLSFIAGIGLASFFPDGWLSKETWWFAGAIVWIIMLILAWNLKKRGLGLVFLFSAVLFFGIWRYSVSMPKNYIDRIWHYNGETIKFTGTVADDPDIRESNVKLKIDAASLMMDNKRLPVKGRVLTTVNIFPEYNYGDRLEIECHLKQPDMINDFSYDRYLARYDIYSVCYYPKAKLVKKAKYSMLSPRWFYNQVLEFRKGIKRTVNSSLGEPESSLAQAITFGIRQSVPAGLNLAFSQTGLTHIMAVSGMNVSILVVLIMNGLLMAGVKRKYAFYATTAWIIGFIILVAMPASAIRAGLMGFLLLWALKLGRLNKMTNSIVLAAAIMLLANPKILRDDVGFQLSFMATMSLVYFYPPLKTWYGRVKLLNFIPKIFTESILVTLAAQVLTLPILIYNFHFISLIAPVANLIALWTILPIMIFTVLGIIFGLFIPLMAKIAFFPVWLMIKYLIGATKILSLVPFSHPQIQLNYWPYFAIYYLILAFFIIKRNKAEISIDFG